MTPPFPNTYVLHCLVKEAMNDIKSIDIIYIFIHNLHLEWETICLGLVGWGTPTPLSAQTNYFSAPLLSDKIFFIFNASPLWDG